MESYYMKNVGITEGSQFLLKVGRDMPKFPANISAIGNDAIWVKKIGWRKSSHIYLVPGQRQGVYQKGEHLECVSTILKPT
ncbi:hypothetical protein NQ314_006448 [Rhamnusium bicolor]|uniref:Uncharacterized protein n=1 Tax=Rhamnusium bicolor TaxID=1586634 RepID=A0AAV8Z3P0_9CUCU|nr:hypothetical protein NQ314_006448 [Rhamnusium bicolor]